LEKDLSLAVMYFEKASKLGHDGASYQLAMMMEDQYTYPDLYDIDQSVALYEKMITSKRKKKTVGTSKSSSSSSLSTTASTSTAVASVGNGGISTLSGPDASALIKLARVYYEGNHQGESRNLDKAYQYARKVAESTGEKYCQFMVGDILLQQKDIQQSLFWLTQSGQQGFPLAIEALARVYFEGIPPLVKQDYELAHEWCLKGDDIWPSGLGYCQSCLGDMYRQGLGVPKDQMKSFEYYQKAASQQDAPQNYARYMLGEL
jgi:TPR repeat protein